jgi:hypothetical protein
VWPTTWRLERAVKALQATEKKVLSPSTERRWELQGGSLPEKPKAPILRDLNS